MLVRLLRIASCCLWHPLPCQHGQHLQTVKTGGCSTTSDVKFVTQGQGFRITKCYTSVAPCIAGILPVVDWGAGGRWRLGSRKTHYLQEDCANGCELSVDGWKDLVAGSLGGFARHRPGSCPACYFCIDSDVSTTTATLKTCDAHLESPRSALHMPPMEVMGMESVKCVIKNRKWEQWLKGSNLSAQRISCTTSLRYS
jgi:hypothetical protein